ncbi:hypothetical protein HAX54_020405 [Datura stramonium]|uniref:Plus3 domain-containing protein n=1 Tax=Datura stramonium TaxID=4076 RepID=A0ABS8UR75_DATST|nr:hypothetical protein [Datura stramonium]
MLSQSKSCHLSVEEEGTDFAVKGLLSQVALSCIGRIDFVLIKGKYGFCNNCLKLALLVEEDRNIDSDGESVDLREIGNIRGSFREYYEILQAVFGRKHNRHRIFSLLESHFVENEELLQKDELDNDLEDDDTEMLVAPKNEKKKLVRVKLDPCDYEQHNSHRLVQIAGIKHGSSDKCNSKSLILVSNMARDVCLSMLSDDEFSKEECDDLREKVKAGLLKSLQL